MVIHFGFIQTQKLELPCTTLQTVIRKHYSITLIYQGSKHYLHALVYKAQTQIQKYEFTSSSRCNIGTSVVLLLGDRPRPIAGPDMVMDFTGSGGGLFPPPLETTELEN